MAVAEAKKPSSGPKKPKSPRAYPSFYQMASDAIETLKERTGSSQYAISKFIEEKHQKQLPSNFKKLLLIQLKKFVASGKLVKVKNSYKLPPASARSPRTVAKPRAVVAAKPKAKEPVAKVAKRKASATERKAKEPAAKVAKTAARASPAVKNAAAVVAKPKKAGAVKAIRKPKPKTVTRRLSVIKSPAKKKVAAKAKK